MNNEPLTIEKLIKLKEMLKPTKMIVTNDVEIYKTLLELPYINKEFVKLSPGVEGTYMIDLDKLREYQLPMCPWRIP